MGDSGCDEVAVNESDQKRLSSIRMELAKWESYTPDEVKLWDNYFLVRIYDDLLKVQVAMSRRERAVRKEPGAEVS